MIGSELVNFRDLGGICTVDGRKVLPKRLLRCGDLSTLTEDTMNTLQNEYHVSNIVDLRTEKERAKASDRGIPGAVYHVLDFFPGEDLMGRGQQATGSREQLLQMQDEDFLHDYMKKLYAEFITTRSARDAIRQFLQILLETEQGATLFHCSAGKDRTGISTAVILTILGVPKETILEDYLKTNRMRANANQMIIDELKGKSVPEGVLKVVEAALSVKKEYLETSYAVAEKEYGSFENYILEGLGISESEQSLLRKLYLE